MVTTINKYTWLGLLLTYVTVSLARFIFTSLYGAQLDDAPFIFRELIHLGMVGVLFWLILNKEKLPLSSFGIRQRLWKETALWSVIISAATLAAILLALGSCKLLHLPYGESKAFNKLSLISITLVCLRGGYFGRSVHAWLSIGALEQYFSKQMGGLRAVAGSIRFTALHSGLGGHPYCVFCGCRFDCDVLVEKEPAR